MFIDGEFMNDKNEFCEKCNDIFESYQSHYCDSCYEKLQSNNKKLVALCEELK
jgi:rRNA maturation endonuclease Nob1